MDEESVETIARDTRHLADAITRLGALMDEPETSSRSWQEASEAFEYTMGLFWKVAKELLAARGIQARMPREALQAARQRGWIQDTGIWIQMLADEYEISGGNHSILTARRVYPRIRAYLPEMQRLQERLAARIEDL